MSGCLGTCFARDVSLPLVQGVSRGSFPARDTRVCSLSCGVVSLLLPLILAMDNNPALYEAERNIQPLPKLCYLRYHSMLSISRTIAVVVR